MNCETMQGKILLAQAGDLSPRGRRILEKHLGQCSACRVYRQDAQRLTELAAVALPAGRPNEWVLTRIRATAAAERGAARPRLFSLPAVRLLASAALLAIIVGGIRMLPERMPRNRVFEMNAIMAMVADDDALQVEALEADDYAALADAESDSNDHTEVLRALADQLLIMEGLAVDEEDWFSLPEEPQPTALQWHNIHGAPDRIYG